MKRFTLRMTGRWYNLFARMAQLEKVEKTTLVRECVQLGLVIHAILLVSPKALSERLENLRGALTTPHVEVAKILEELAESSQAASKRKAPARSPIHEG